ncbi:MAG: lactonase family protein [Sphingobacterium composti]
METSYAQVYKMYVGTYTNNNHSKGVYVFDFDEISGKATLNKTINMSNPSFLARNGDKLYAVNEDTKGMVSVYDLAQDKVLSQVSTNGMHPCHIALSPKDPIAVVSNYSSGSLCLFSLNGDGSINSMDDFIKFDGSSINKERQNNSHIHSAFFNKEGTKIYVSDLGTDFIYVFDIVFSDGKYYLHKAQDIKTKLGGGPRHLVLSKDQNTIYSVLELTGEVEVFQYSGSDWISKQIVPMFPKDFDGEHGGADIKIDKKGKYVYATNRGTANFMYKYRVKSNGLLEKVGHVSVYGDSPRNVNISLKEKSVFIANQITNNITILDNKSLMSEPVYNKLELPNPVCVIF